MVAGTTGRILIVDDEPDDAILLERIALQIGFKVLTIDARRARRRCSPVVLRTSGWPPPPEA